MFESYIPKKFCREFVDIKGYSSQLALIMATVKGIKPCMDDWVSMDRYDQYEKVCKKYGLFIIPDVVFKMVPKSQVAGKIVGGNRLVTTVALGQPFDKNNKNREYLAHVFLSRSKSDLDRCMKDGWYPLIINNRLIDKPLIDNFKFGYGLGYPKCCVDYFHKYNNWLKYSYLYEALKNTKSFNFLCNPFLKDSTYSYIYHMPCSYGCSKTIKLAKIVRAAIKEEDPRFVKVIDRYLQLPILVFYETKIYAFEGKVKNGRLYYKKVYYTGIDPENNIYEGNLQKGNCVFIDRNDVVILKNGKLLERIKAKKKEFAPESPFIVQFKE